MAQVGFEPDHVDHKHSALTTRSRCRHKQVTQTQTHLLHNLNAYSHPPRNIKATIFNSTNINISEPDITPEKCRENLKHIHTTIATHSHYHRNTFTVFTLPSPPYSHYHRHKFTLPSPHIHTTIATHSQYSHYHHHTFTLPSPHIHSIHTTITTIFTLPSPHIHTIITSHNTSF